MTPARSLFVAMFAGQAAFLVLAPILPEMSREFGVATATAGQLRLVSGSRAALVALTLAPLARRLDLRSLLSVGLGLLAADLWQARLPRASPSIAAAQLAVGAGLGIVVSAAIAAAAEWEAPERGARAVSWALLGQPAAWVVGMPVAGAVAGIDWRLAWLAVPFLPRWSESWRSVVGQPAAAAAGLRAGWRHVWRQPAVAAWAFGELFAFAAWGGTLVFSGALFIESYGASAATVGVVLAAGAAAYFPGSFLVRRNLDDAARPLLIGLALALALGVAAFGTLRPGIVFSAALFAVLVFLAGDAPSRAARSASTPRPSTRWRLRAFAPPRPSSAICSASSSAGSRSRRGGMRPSA